jgi:hypothetical protein
LRMVGFWFWVVQPACVPTVGFSLWAVYYVDRMYSDKISYEVHYVTAAHETSLTRSPDKKPSVWV